MNKPAAHPPILGYVSPLSAQPGQNLSFCISSAGNQSFSARVVRIHCADPNPEGPGMQFESVDFPLETSYPGNEQHVYPGSCALALMSQLSSIQNIHKFVELRILIKPTFIKEGLQVLASLQNAMATKGIALALDQGELVVLEYQENGAEPVALRTGLLVVQDRWQSVSLNVAVAQQTVTVSIGPAPTCIPGAVSVTEHRNTLLSVDNFSWSLLTHLCLGALWKGHPEQGYDGLIENPSLYVGEQATDLHVLLQWNLAQAMLESLVPGVLPGMPGLRLINTPVRAVRSSLWSGEHLDWNHAPDEYAAMYFHADALTDCDWQESVSLRIPTGMKSGVYGLEITHPDGSDTIPFYVTPAPSGPRARVLFLAPTLTYQAYANHARGNYAGELSERIARWGAYPHNPDVVTQFGASTYNRHRDLAGISLSSRLRPMLTMRPGYLTFYDQQGSGLRHFPADSHLTYWLREKGIEYDVITDEDLDDQGLSALRPYDVVMTGSHPEYHTRRMIESLIAYRESGGYLMYMGANGFYWKIARPASAPHLLEIRRAEGGIRAWASEPGEYYHQLDGGYGGMWRRNGIAPQCTGGVGFAVQGGFEGVGYRRTNESYDTEVAWLFQGVEGEIFGDFGLSGGGAAGFELDQVVPELGSPQYLKIVGISDGHGPSFRIVPEEILTWTFTASLPRQYEGVRAHMAVGIAESGGGLFAAGSITFMGSLVHNECNNNVSRIVENCLRRFLSA